MQRRLRQAFCSIKEHTSVSYAKIATIGGLCDLDLIVIKATSPDDFPLNEKYVHELLKIFSISPASLRTFAMCFSRRFTKTQCWRVALKSLLLLHRLLRSLPENSPFRTELLWTRFNGYLSLNPCNFQDFSSSAAEDYTLFIRSYALLLDEALDSSPFERIDTEEAGETEDPENLLLDKMKNLARLIEILPQLQSLIDRVMDCRPRGVSAKNFIIQSAMKHIIRDSFICYTIFRKEIVVVLDNLIQLPYRSCVEAFDIYKKAAIQAKHLSEFYDWSKSMGLCGAYEYPFVDRIPEIQIRALGSFLNGMWQLTESSSSTMSTLTSSNMHSPSSVTEDDGDKTLIKPELDKKFEDGKKKNDEIQPLIELENDNNNVNWESLLEASLPSSPCIFPSNNNGYGFEYQYGHCSPNLCADQMNGWQMQVYNPYGNPNNPFYHPNYGPLPDKTTHPWGL
ncbi:hypothetical protein M9H77_09045 [Catharanthus roseus]|uniref:Uncharacterized protein n=1 Tax=Catharanthus roseus TaxID=4058 RepID=A0ACC0BZJ6_CATRO|nr:hypothetical protein M9H77_09045 [Catharanthus roseus]